LTAKWSPIGRNMVDRTFRNTYSVSEITASLRCTIDPERSLAIWSMPDRLWVYNFDNEMWSDVSLSAWPAFRRAHGLADA
jgi:hypothetical protein